MTTTDEPDAIADLDFPAPHAHLTIDELHSAWHAEYARIRRWRYEDARIWAMHAGEPEADVWIRKAELRRLIRESEAITLELEDALVEARKVKPTDIPQAWTGGGA